MSIPLYKLLQRHPSSPDTGFDKFVVGRTNNFRAELINRLNRMRAGYEPTGGQLILANNGNGKTLLNKSLQEVASNINKEPLEKGEPPSFEILFSRISFSHIDTSNAGVELAKNLKRSYQEPSDITYASISAEILKRFTTEYKSHWTLRWVTAPVKIGLKYAIKKYEDYIQDLLESAADEASGGGVDHVFAKINSWLKHLCLTEEFIKYARSKKMSHFLEAYIQGQQGYKNVEELNKALFNDIAATFGRGQPQDMAATLASMANSVGCKVLILQIDDCNDKQSIDFLLPIAEYFNEFSNPKLYIIASAVRDVWHRNVDFNLDQSAKQKVEEFFCPIELSPPSDEELTQLADRIEVLIQTEEATNMRILSWPNDSKLEALEKCKGKSFREATKILIDDAEQYLSIRMN